MRTLVEIDVSASVGKSRVIGLRLDEDTLSNLNAVLPELGYSNIVDLVRDIASRKFQVTENLVQNIAEKVVQQMYNTIGVPSTLMQNRGLDHVQNNGVERIRTADLHRPRVEC